MRPQEWMIDLDAPRDRVYEALEDLILGRGEPLPGVRNVRTLSSGEAVWTVDGPTGTMEFRVRVRERRPPERLTAEGQGSKASMAVRSDLTELGPRQTRCHVALEARLPFLLDRVAGPIVAREHDRVGRKLTRLLTRRAASEG